MHRRCACGFSPALMATVEAHRTNMHAIGSVPLGLKGRVFGSVAPCSRYWLQVRSSALGCGPRSCGRIERNVSPSGCSLLRSRSESLDSRGALTSSRRRAFAVRIRASRISTRGVARLSNATTGCGVIPAGVKGRAPSMGELAAEVCAGMSRAGRSPNGMSRRAPRLRPRPSSNRRAHCGGLY